MSDIDTVKREQIYETTQRANVLPVEYIGRFPKLDTAPSVLNVKTWVTQNTVGTTIVDFKNGAEGQPLYILGEGFTTIANNAKIKTNTGANKLLAANKVYTFRKINGVWYENE